MSRLNSWKNAVVVSSAVGILSAVYTIFTGLAFQSDINGWVNAITVEDFASADTFADNLVISEAAYTLAPIPFAVALLMTFSSIIGWTHTNAKLAEAIDSDALTHSTGWAIGAWFVPVLNLFRPRRILAESLRIRGHGPLINLLNIWWVLFLLDSALLRVPGDAISGAYDAIDAADEGDIQASISAFNGLSVAVTWDIVSSLFSVVPLILVAVLVLRASKQAQDISQLDTENGFASGPTSIRNFDQTIAATKVGIMPNEVNKKCLFCAEEIKFEAIKCKHCGSDIR
jgi:hypothetical protein